MGVYIEGMEMPKEGSWTTVRIYPDGTCAVPNWQGDCTLIKGAKAAHVPQHGRLIDADAFASEMKKRQTEAYKWLGEAKDHDTAVRADAVISFLCEVKLTLDSASTIIPAEEGET